MKKNVYLCHHLNIKRILMHIVEIPSFFPPYGGEFCLDQAKALCSFGHTVRIISNVQLSVRKSVTDFCMYSYGRKWMEMDGVSVYYSYTRGIPMMIKPNVERWVKTVRQMFADYVQKYGLPDIIHAHCAHRIPAAHYTALPPGAPPRRSKRARGHRRSLQLLRREPLRPAFSHRA